MLNQVLKNLDEISLTKSSKISLIGCPFSFVSNGPILCPLYSRRENEPICSQLCGVLFPRAYRPGTCPCHELKTPGYVKHRFWQHFNKANGLKGPSPNKLHETIKWHDAEEVNMLCQYPACDRLKEYENRLQIKNLTLICNTCSEHRDWGLDWLSVYAETTEAYKKVVNNELKLERYAREQDAKRSILWRRFDKEADRNPFYKFEKWLNKFFREEVDWL